VTWRSSRHCRASQPCSAKAGLGDYVVEEYDYADGMVTVSARPPEYLRGVTAQVQEHTMLNEATQVIEAAGFTVQRDQVGYGVALIVGSGEAA
jgi:hypothetical protein